MVYLLDSPRFASATPPSDSFNRADSASVLGVTDVGGLAYTQGGGVSRTWGIDNNQAYLATANGSGIHSYSAELNIGMSDNYTVTTAISVAGNNGDDPALYARGGHAIIRCSKSGASSYLWAYTNGSYRGQLGGAYVLGDTFGIKLVGTTIYFLRNGSVELTRTGESGSLSNTTVGIWVTLTNASGGSNPSPARFNYLNITTP